MRLHTGSRFFFYTYTHTLIYTHKKRQEKETRRRQQEEIGEGGRKKHLLSHIFLHTLGLKKKYACFR